MYALMDAKSNRNVKDIDSELQSFTEAKQRHGDSTSKRNEYNKVFSRY